MHRENREEFTARTCTVPLSNSKLLLQCDITELCSDSADAEYVNLAGLAVVPSVTFSSTVKRGKRPPFKFTWVFEITARHLILMLDVVFIRLDA